MTVSIETLAIVRDQSAGLIRAEVRAAKQRERLYSAVCDSIRKLGLGIDEVSEASGLTPDEIRRVLDEPRALEDLAVLAGIS